jgi:hypothetical protein
VEFPPFFVPFHFYLVYCSAFLLHRFKDVMSIEPITFALLRAAIVFKEKFQGVTDGGKAISSRDFFFRTVALLDFQPQPHNSDRVKWRDKTGAPDARVAHSE